MSSSILQAMSSRTPILASNVNGINNLIGKKKYLGLLFNNNLKNLKNRLFWHNSKLNTKIFKEYKNIL